MLSVVYAIYIHSKHTHKSELSNIEGLSSSNKAEGLAKQLFTALFKDDLDTRADKVCCTKNTKNRTTLNQGILEGIRCKYYSTYVNVLHCDTLRYEKSGNFEQIISF